MLLEPNAIVLYVENLESSSAFYQELLGLKVEEASPTFHSFKLSNGMSLGLKAKHSVVPPLEGKNGNGELAFIVDDHKTVEALFAEWQTKKVKMILTPSILPYGFTFVAVDLDGNRLRVVSLGKS